MLLQLAWRNLWRHPRRTWLTAGAIAFSAALLVFMITIQLGSYDLMLESALRTYTGQMQIQREGYLDRPQLRASIAESGALAARLRAAVPAAAIAVRANGFALVASEARTYGVPVVGVEPGHEPAVSTLPGLVTRGRYLSGPRAQEAVLGATLARNLKVGVGDEVTLLGTGRDGSIAAAVLPIVGVFASGNPELDRNLVQLPLGTFQEIYAMEGHAHAIVISGPALEAADEIAAQVRAALPAGRDGLVLLDWEQLMPGLRQLIEADMLSAWFVYIVLIVVVTFSILNTFLMSVLERTREFGIMLALGATPLRIGALVMLESALLTALGLGIGVALGGAVAGYFYVRGFTFPGLEEIYSQYGLPGVIYPELSFQAVSIGPAVIFVFTLAAALYPALRIRRLRPVEAMRAA